MIQAGFKSDKGMKRTNNEDACFIVPSDNVYIVADGVGGNNAGEIASRTAVSMIAEYIREHDFSEMESDEDLRRYFTEALTRANTEIYGASRRFAENKGMATTVVITYIRGLTAYVMNIGDSRAYVVRGTDITPVTIDHTYVNELIASGAITPEEGASHPKRNMITRAVGGDAVVNPDFFKVELEKDDIIIMCTDGLYDELSPEEMVETVLNVGTMNEAAKALVRRANSKGGRDNVTVICLKV